MLLYSLILFFSARVPNFALPPPSLESSLGEKGLLRLCVFAIFTLFLSACATQPYYKANAIYPDAHDGGSIVEFSPNERILISGGWEGRVRLWSLPSGEALNDWQAHDDTVNGIVFVSSTRLITAGYDAHLVRWSIEGKKLQDKTLPSAVTHMIAAKDQGWLITGHADGWVRLWAISDFKPITERQLHSDQVAALAYDATSGKIASSDTGQQVMLWQPGSEPVVLQSPASYSRTLVFSADGMRLYGGGWFDLFQWDTDTGKLKVIATEHAGIIKSLDRTPAGQLASISRQTDSSVYLLDADSGVVKQRYQPHELCGGYIRVSPSGRYWATTSDDASVRFWDHQHLELSE
ncbi:MAG TPA: hypothetical protein ENI64_05295 [Gammaproteobacteria bacterium]|nr:hypothetical protein [Gammaproteobacteria bacterium]